MGKTSKDFEKDPKEKERGIEKLKKTKARLDKCVNNLEQKMKLTRNVKFSSSLNQQHLVKINMQNICSTTKALSKSQMYNPELVLTMNR